MSDFIILEKELGEYWVGWGPFFENHEPLENKLAFYVNDFYLSDSYPWKHPVRWEKWDELDLSQFPVFSSLLLLSDGGRTQLVDFNNVFSKIKIEIDRGLMEKAVPVIQKKWKFFNPGMLPTLMRECKKNFSKKHRFYCVKMGEVGMIGLSPELLIEKHGRDLKSMSLAGTAKRGQEENLRRSSKDQHEHEWVLKHILNCFRLFSTQVKAAEQEVVTHKQICHLKTDITAQWDGVSSINDMIKKLHPTPALGTYPKINRNLRVLKTWRDMTDTHPYFGAPVGMSYGTETKILVAIRNLIFDHSDLLLHSGCGVVKESTASAEWNELLIKRGAVRGMFSI